MWGGERGVCGCVGVWVKRCGSVEVGCEAARVMTRAVLLRSWPAKSKCSGRALGNAPGCAGRGVMVRGVRGERRKLGLGTGCAYGALLRDHPLRYWARQGDAPTRPHAMTIQTVFRATAARGLAPINLGPCTPGYQATPDKSG